MKSRLLVLSLCLMVIVAVSLLAPGLDDLRFQPSKPVGFSLGPAKNLILPRLDIADDTPVWRILLIWLAFVIDLALFLLLLPRDLRKRLLRQLIGFAVSVLVFVLALRFRILKWPEMALEEPGAGVQGIDVPAAPVGALVFEPPQVSSWITLAAGALLLWLLLLVLYLGYRSWRRYRTPRSSTLGDIAEIARTSLADLAAGQDWGDVVMRAYARMNDAVRAARGMERESSTTPREFAARLARTGLPAASVEELTRLFEAVRYGGRASDDAEAKHAAACLESILRACGVAA